MRRIHVLAVALVSLAACGDSNSSPDGAGVDARAVDAPAPVMATGTVVEARDSAPIAGAQVCLLDTPAIPCASTDAAGAYAIALPAWTTGLDLAVNVTAAGHLGFTGLVHESASGVLWFAEVPLMDDAAATAMLHAQAGFDYPAPGKAFVLFSVFHAAGGALVGETATVSPASGPGPVYAQPSGAFDPTLPGLTANGYLLFGDLTPGKLEITVAGTACAPAPLSFEAWTSATPNTVAGETAAGSMTQMTAICH